MVVSDVDIFFFFSCTRPYVMRIIKYIADVYLGIDIRLQKNEED